MAFPLIVQETFSLHLNRLIQYLLYQSMRLYGTHNIVKTRRLIDIKARFKGLPFY